MDIPTIVIFVTAAALLLSLLIIIDTSKNNARTHIPNYKALFIIGISWLPIGLATHNPGLWGTGSVFLAVGLINRGKWGQQTKWSDLPQRTRTLKIVFITGLLLLLVLALGYSLGRPGQAV